MSKTFRATDYDNLAPSPVPLKGKTKKRRGRSLKVRQALSEGKRGQAAITMPVFKFMSGGEP